MQFKKYSSYSASEYNWEIIWLINWIIWNQWTQRYNTQLASIELPYDTRYIQESTQLNLQLTDYTIMLLIGIGGSNLWTLAFHDGIWEKRKSKKKIFFLDTIDVYSYKKTVDGLCWYLEKGEKLCITVISKSGTTTETIALFESIYADIYKKYTSQSTIVCITDENSKLWNIGHENSWHLLSIPKNVGGRYSIFSNVGLFPLKFLGYNIEQILFGAQSAIADFLENPKESAAFQNAEMLFQGYTKENRNICEHFFFWKHYENIGKWYRQLLAESIGKEKIWVPSVGITPTTSIGTIDLHSIWQLDIAHWSDRSIILVFPEDQGQCFVPIDTPFTPLVEDIRGRSFETILRAAYEWTRLLFIEKQIPIMTYTLQDGDESEIWYFMQSKMLEVILLWEFFQINPFDQPNVEEYKKWMRSYLQWAHSYKEIPFNQ